MERIGIEISDNGKGIDAEDIQKIFDPFYTTKELGQGTGLGLSISYGIIKEQGGDIEVRSEPGKETTFTITLPVETEETNGLQETEIVPKDRKIEKKRILVVDDEPTIREMFSDILTLEGHEIDTAQNGVNALDKIMHHSEYDLIIADLKMPILDGPDLYESLKEISPAYEKKIIFATGDVISKSSREFLKKTGSPFIAKPFGIEDVRNKINSFFGENSE